MMFFHTAKLPCLLYYSRMKTKHRRKNIYMT